MKENTHIYRARAQIAKALAHPSRLMILDALRNKERCVCELTTLVGGDQSTISKHLNVLKNAGLVTDRKDGTSSYYRLQCACLEGFFQCIESVLRQNLKQQARCCGVRSADAIGQRRMRNQNNLKSQHLSGDRAE